MNILVIDDDENMLDYIINAFRIGWPEAHVTTAVLGQEGLTFANNQPQDIALVDLGLPDITGFEVITSLRKFSEIPVVVISAREEEREIIKALGLGADEYVTKPFGQLELVARVRALTKREAKFKPLDCLIYGSFRFNPQTNELSYKGCVASMTKTEGRLVYRLIRSRGEVVTLKDLAEEVYGSYSDGNENIRIFMYRLRRKLESLSSNQCSIITKPGIGYSLKITGETKYG
jgi:two-component system KDP operon response regulator KdpE